MKSYRSILERLRKTVAGLEQQINDVNHWNGLPQAANNTIDIEDVRLALYHAKRAVALWEGNQTEKAIIEVAKVRLLLSEEV